MGFVDILKKVGEAAVDGIKEYGAKNLEYKDKWEERYSRMSDEQLRKERRDFKDGKIYSSQQEKMVRINVLAQEMRDRGLIE